MKKIIVVLVVLIIGAWLYNSQADKHDQSSENVVESITQQVEQVSPAIYVVKPGEGLWHVAEKELGDGKRWLEIAKENKIDKPYLLEVDQELKIPDKETKELISKSKTYTLEEVGQHGDKNSCWMVIDNNVYDVTPFVESGFHPGKAAILEGCGIDATELFNTRPMGSGTSHSERARKMLPKYLIGELAK